MSDFITETDTYPAEGTIVRPLPGEEIRSVDWVNGVGAVANRTKYLKARIEGVVNYTRFCPLFSGFSPAGFTMGTGGDLIWGQTANPGSVCIALPIIQASGTAKLTSVTAWFRPVNGHGALPATQPKLTIWSKPSDGTPPASLGTLTLTAASVVLYEVPQNLPVVMGGGGHTIINTESYYAIFEGETGANSMTGLQLTMVRLTTSP